MALADLQQAKPERIMKGPACAVCEALATLNEDEASALRQLLSDPTWRYSALSDALASDPDTPLDLAAYTLSWHARGKCKAREKLR